MQRFKMLHLICIVSLLLVCLIGTAQSAEVKSNWPKTPAEGSKAYYKWIKYCFSRLEEDMPSISASADAAAQKFVKDDYKIAAWGDPGFVAEFTSRAGGLMPVSTISDSAAVPEKTIILIALTDMGLRNELAKIKAFRANGNVVVAFARTSIIEKTHAIGAHFDSVIDNCAAEEDGLFRGNTGFWMVPTNPTANTIALWTWTGEFIGACRRLGKMPVIRQSECVSGGQERNAKYTSVGRFHDGSVLPSKPCTIGIDYLKKLGENFDQVFAGEGRNLRAASELAIAARRAHHNLYYWTSARTVSPDQEYAGDPGYFKPVSDFTYQINQDTLFKSGDYLLCISGEHLQNQGLVSKARESGATLVWSMPDYVTDSSKVIGSGEIYVNQHCAVGDAVCTVPYYDVKILPTSGVIAQSMLWMISADIYKSEHK